MMVHVSRPRIISGLRLCCCCCIEADDSDLSDVGSEKEVEIYSSSDDNDNDNEAVHSKRRKKRKDLLESLYDNTFIDPGNGYINFQVGQVFDDVTIFRGALRDFSIRGGFLLTYKKNDLKRVTAKCSNVTCKWRIHASVLLDNRTFMIKKLNDVHSCVQALGNKNPHARTKWIAHKLKVLLQGDSSVMYKSMQATLENDWGIQAPLWQLYKARNMARCFDAKVHAESFKKLRTWITGIQRSNPGTCFQLEYQPRDNLDHPPQFKRIFVCFKGMKQGFLEGCRPFIGLDGCHLKGPYGGVLLAAVSMDGNKGIYPLAIGIVEVECYSSWIFFLDSLKSCIGDGDEDKSFTFMSDQQKGIIDAVKEIFPNASQRHCAQHLWMNFKSKFPGSGLRKEFWGAVTATSAFDFRSYMRKMKDQSDGQPNEWLLKLPLSEWSKHAYWPEAKSEHITNNMTETFNAWILRIRSSPIVDLLESYRQKCMFILHKRHAKGCAMEGKLVPGTKKATNVVIKGARQCKLIPGRNGEFEVKDGNASYAVSMPNKKCNCGWWEVSGIPCRHVALRVQTSLGSSQTIRTRLDES
ncbi:uncharacterized protein [Euphorbia lathyris]|uniref:uncharacterized protein n=1 Tax=Euphorbia lathyris TaxID=212925 RepID=UPI0033138301